MSANTSNHATADKGKGKAPRSPPPGVVFPLQPRSRVPRGESTSTARPAQPNGGSGAAVADPFTSAGLAARLNSITLSGDSPKFEPGNVLIKHLLSGSTPDEAAEAPSSAPGPAIVASAKAKGKQSAKENAPIGPLPVGSIPRKVRFTTDVGPVEACRYLKVIEIEDRADFDDGIAALSADFQFHLDEHVYDLKISEPSNMCTTFTAWLVFNDLEVTPAFQSLLDIVRPKWKYEWVSHSAYDGAVGYRIYANSTPAYHYDGQFVFVCRPLTAITAAGLDELESGITQLGFDHGKVFASKDIPWQPSTDWQYRFELTRITDAHEVLKKINFMNPHHFSQFAVTAQPYGDNLSLSTDNDHLLHVTCSPTGRTAWSTGSNGVPRPCTPPIVVPKVPEPYCYRDRYEIDSATSYQQADPFVSSSMAQAGPSTHPNQGGLYRPPQRRGDSAPNGQPLRNRQLGRRDDTAGEGSESQAVVLDRIVSGQDVRTTLMMRNIPNSWTFRELKRRVDQVAKDQYDFSYLRIDFEKNTNVGYGFINLISPSTTAQFVENIQGTEWSPGSHPRKNVQLSYAAVQGIDCIVDKFRNSSIMSEFPDYRPKLWYTPFDAPHPAAVGTEKPFPPSNNITKHQRSRDNAGSIGLFPPQHRRQYGDRSRRSQYDRGTQHQMTEEALYSAPAYGYDNYTAAPGQQYLQPPMPMAQHPAFMQYMPTYGPGPYVYNPAPYYPPQPMQFGGQYMLPPTPQGWPHPPPPQAFGTAYAGNPQQVPRVIVGGYQQVPPPATNQGTVAEAETEEVEASNH
ncbi:hypothetical protein CKM354_001039700 [Cercospora kikuchii]|uniref:Mei2-like C-terminal RNA recognition motif domain-containing protein n=1 Tax=Cercospora kikuchii TaxID=84275 RepID=A0A9P3CTI2_9PEZI|nr:uncharacterized protein CKM354_001039700 [Cercospora kikuchii]GIZ47302.1 hypothetical protein CKM354_001039700 [Cercospora kikuchii]